MTTIFGKFDGLPTPLPEPPGAWGVTFDHAPPCSGCGGDATECGCPPVGMPPIGTLAPRLATGLALLTVHNRLLADMLAEMLVEGLEPYGTDPQVAAWLTAGDYVAPAHLTEAWQAGDHAFWELLAHKLTVTPKWARPSWDDPLIHRLLTGQDWTRRWVRLLERDPAFPVPDPEPA